LLRHFFRFFAAFYVVKARPTLQAPKASIIPVTAIALAIMRTLFFAVFFLVRFGTILAPLGTPLGTPLATASWHAACYRELARRLLPRVGTPLAAAASWHAACYAAAADVRTKSTWHDSCMGLWITRWITCG